MILILSRVISMADDGNEGVDNVVVQEEQNKTINNGGGNTMGRIARYGAVVAATLVLSSAPNCYRSMKLSSLQPADGFPAYGQSKNMKVELVERNGKLETYFVDGGNVTPVYSRNGTTLIFNPKMCSVLTPQEMQGCEDIFASSNGSTGIIDGIERFVGGAIRSGIKAIEDLVGGGSSNNQYQNNQYQQRQYQAPQNQSPQR